jgi:N-acetylglutamate synthase-like GNAT family acetyltransferase
MDGVISNEYSKATVKPSKTLPEGVLEVSNVFTEPAQRKQGYATELIKQITDAADESNINGAYAANLQGKNDTNSKSK